MEETTVERQNKIIKRFNDLQGRKLKRSKLEKLMLDAKGVVDVIYTKLKAALDNSEKEFFKITNVTKVHLKKGGLSAPRHKGAAKEGLDDCGRLKPCHRFENKKVVKTCIPKKKKVKTKALKKKAIPSKRVSGKKIKAKRKPVRASKAKLSPLKQITLVWHEGIQLFENEKFTSWTAFQNALRRIFLNRTSDIGYDKVKFIAEWENGKKIVDRLDLGFAAGDLNPTEVLVGDYLKDNTAVMYDSNFKAGERAGVVWKDKNQRTKRATVKEIKKNLDDRFRRFNELVIEHIVNKGKFTKKVAQNLAESQDKLLKELFKEEEFNTRAAAAQVLLVTNNTTKYVFVLEDSFIEQHNIIITNAELPKISGIQRLNRQKPFRYSLTRLKTKQLIEKVKDHTDMKEISRIWDRPFDDKDLEISKTALKQIEALFMPKKKR